MKKIVSIGSVLLLVFVCIIIGAWFLSSEFSEERSLFQASDDVKRVIIESSNPDNHEIYTADSKNDVNDLKECFSKVSFHIGEGIQEDYKINFINDCTLHSIPFPDLFLQSQIDKVNTFIKDENKKYQYTFQVENSIDFQELKQSIYDSGNIAYLPYASMNGTKPSISLKYITVAKNENDWDKAFYSKYNFEIGEFEYDNYFIPFINDLKAEGLYFDNTNPHFSSGNGLNFSRGVEIYLNRSLTEDEIIKIRDKSNESYIIGDPQRFHPVTNFIYNEVKEYEVKVMFAREQRNEELKEFCQKYNIDSFDYEKDLLDFDSMTIYFFKNTVSPDNLNPSEYKSLFLSKDLNLIVKEYEPVDFVPFEDADTPFSIIEQKKISENDYQEIRKIISNYDILRISDNLGFADYEFDRFCYIGIQIDDELYVCGGQDPFSNNERFFNIRSQILKILNIDFNF